MVSGDVEGNITQLYTRFNKANKKTGPFDLLLCAGDFFGRDSTDWDQYKSGKLKAPVSTLILGPCKPELSDYYPESEAAELCDNITYLGRHGRFRGSSGLQIAYFSGLEGQGERSLSTFGAKNAADFLQPIGNSPQYKGVDILLTSQWPRGVDKYASDAGVERRMDSTLIGEVARVVKPRYHFAACEGVNYERQPYRNHRTMQEMAEHVTRFIALAKLTNKEKRKSLYAFTIVPMCGLDKEELIKQPSDATECPYKPCELQAPQEESSQQFFYDMSQKSRDNRGGKRRGHPDKGGGGRGRGGKTPRKGDDASDCWFCLGSPQVEKHLVVSVGSQSYVALAKGGLVADHVLILPIHHHRCAVSAPEESSLRKYFKAEGKTVVFFERNYKSSHLQVQCVPVPSDTLQELKDTFMQCAEAQSFELFEIPKHSDLKQIVAVGSPYFYAELPMGERLLHRISEQFPLQFGREALAEPPILNMPERVDWRNCKASQDEESQQAAAFKSTFHSFDFNFM
ncbi:hypothetical protein ACOMHN_001512 [Nucella lapillus]